MDGQLDSAEQQLKLMQVIEKFAETRTTEKSGRMHGLETVEGAYCMCDSTSDAFIRFAHAAGVTLELSRYDFDLDTTICLPEGGIQSQPSPRNPDPTLYQRGKHPTAEFHRAGWHAIVETPEFFLDFTARQYHHEACYPHIISKKLAAAAAAGGD
jgi:hypothetical protein